MSRYLVFLLVSCLSLSCTDPKNTWYLSDPILEPGPYNSPDEVSVKDPTIVNFGGLWHLFYTARDSLEYTTRYVSAPVLGQLQTAKKYDLPQIRGKTRYGSAPQVFFFGPQNIWYLIFQNRDSNYQPAFSINSDISDAGGWSEPTPLLRKDADQKWIDFWVIADETKVYLFYTQSHTQVFYKSTNYKDFPHGWSEAKAVFSGVHEAVHIYKVKEKKEYHMIYELNQQGVRSYGLAIADHLEGPWQKSTDSYATGDQLVFKGQNKWTDMVSHGEAIRSGYDQKMEYDPFDAKWIFQGVLKEEITNDYPSIPWKLGIISKVE